MTEWTQTIEKNKVEFRLNAVETHVTISSLEGEYTESVVNIKRKLNDPNLLSAVRSMFQSMLDYYNQNKRG